MQRILLNIIEWNGIAQEIIEYNNAGNQLQTVQNRIKQNKNQ